VKFRRFATELLPIESLIDRLSGLAVVFLEQVGVDAQGDIGLGVTHALADRHDVDVSVDQLAGVSVPQRMERHLWHADLLGVLTPCRADSIPREWGTLNIRK
jgi:hypothetical protein